MRFPEKPFWWLEFDEHAKIEEGRHGIQEKRSVGPCHSTAEVDRESCGLKTEPQISLMVRRDPDSVGGCLEASEG